MQLVCVRRLRVDRRRNRGRYWTCARNVIQMDFQNKYIDPPLHPLMGEKIPNQPLPLSRPTNFLKFLSLVEFSEFREFGGIWWNLANLVGFGGVYDIQAPAFSRCYRLVFKSWRVASLAAGVGVAGLGGL